MTPAQNVSLFAAELLMREWNRWRVVDALAFALKGPLAVHVDGPIIVGRMVFREAA